MHNIKWKDPRTKDSQVLNSRRSYWTLKTPIEAHSGAYRVQTQFKWYPHFINTQINIQFYRWWWRRNVRASEDISLTGMFAQRDTSHWEPNQIHVIIYKTIHFRGLSWRDSTEEAAQISIQDTSSPFHYPRCSLRYNTEKRLLVLRRQRGRWDTAGKEGRAEREVRKSHVYMYTRERVSETEGGGGLETHCIRILCKRITSDYARLSANRITSLLFARRQAVDLVNSNSILPRAESPTERSGLLRSFFLSRAYSNSGKIKRRIKKHNYCTG